MATAAIYDLPTRINDTTSKAIPFQFLDKFKNPIDLTNSSLNIQFRRDCKTGEVVYDIEIGSGITLVDAINGKFEINKFKLEWGAGVYFYDIKSVISTIEEIYIKGQIIIEQNVTVKP